MYRYVTNRITFVTDPSGLQQGKENWAGLDISKALKKTMDIARKEFNKLSVADRVDLARGLYSLKYYKLQSQRLAAYSWDIVDFYKTEDRIQTPWQQGKYGAENNKIYVTVKGETHFAGAVNYFLWGMINREIYEMVYNGKNVPAPSWWSLCPNVTTKSGLIVGVDGRPDLTFFHAIDVISPYYSLFRATSMVRAFRVVSYLAGKSKNYGINERIAWTQAGWYNDFKKASHVKRDKEAKPSTVKYTGRLFKVQIIGETKTWTLTPNGDSLKSSIKEHNGASYVPPR